MEFNMNDILAALQSGQDPQDIANSFADQLNAAIRQKAESDKTAAEKDEKVARLQEILDLFFAFIEDYYPEIYDEDTLKKLTAAELIEGMDEIYDEVLKISPTLDELERVLVELFTEKDTAKPEPKVKEKINPISAFLFENGLKS